MNPGVVRIRNVGWTIEGDLFVIAPSAAYTVNDSFGVGRDRRRAVVGAYFRVRPHALCRTTHCGYGGARFVCSEPGAEQDSGLAHFTAEVEGVSTRW